MSCLQDEELLAVARGEATPAQLEHCQSCPTCGPALEWARTEVALARRHAEAHSEPAPAALWEAIAARTAQPKIRRRWPVLAGLGGLAAAAALVAFLVHRPATHDLMKLAVLPPVPAGGGDPLGPPGGQLTAPPSAEPDQTIRDAASEYEKAIDDLEKAYEQRRAKIDPRRAAALDVTLAGLRHTVDTARDDAARDPRHATQMLRAYRGYLRTLRSAIALQEA